MIVNVSVLALSTKYVRNRNRILIMTNNENDLVLLFVLGGGRPKLNRL